MHNTTPVLAGVFSSSWSLGHKIFLMCLLFFFDKYSFFFSTIYVFEIWHIHQFHANKIKFCIWMCGFYEQIRGREMHTLWQTEWREQHHCHTKLQFILNILFINFLSMSRRHFEGNYLKKNTFIHVFTGTLHHIQTSLLHLHMYTHAHTN